MILVGGIGTVILSGPAIAAEPAQGPRLLAVLQLRPLGPADVRPDGRLASRCRAQSRDLFRAPTPGSAASAAASRWRRSPPAAASAPSAAPRPRPPRPWARSRCRSCGATATRRPLATGTLAAGGTLGILIPPSVVLIVYADHRRGEHRHAVRRGADPGPARDALLHRHDRRLRAGLVPEAGPEGRGGRRGAS